MCEIWLRILYSVKKRVKVKAAVCLSRNNCMNVCVRIVLFDRGSNCPNITGGNSTGPFDTFDLCAKEPQRERECMSEREIDTENNPTGAGGSKSCSSRRSSNGEMKLCTQSQEGTVAPKHVGNCARGTTKRPMVEMCSRRRHTKATLKTSGWRIGYDVKGIEGKLGLCSRNLPLSSG